MRLLAGLCVLGLMLTSTPAWAQDVQELRRELEEMRKQFEAMKGQYEKAIQTMTERINRLEAQPQPTATQPPAVQAPAIGQVPPAGGQPTLLELARPREPFALYGQRGPGQLLFDMGLTGDFVANITQRRVENANAGTFPGRENRFFPREIELGLFGQVDPYASAYALIEAGEETAGEETSVRLAEAALTLLTLPYGTQLKMGQMRNRFGYSNQIHEHDLPWVDRPDVLRAFFGEEGLIEKGAELTWVPPLPFYLEALFGVFNGDNETAFGLGRLRAPLITGRVRTFFELTDTSAIQLGASVAHGETAENLRSTLVGYDLKYKYRPEGWLHPLFTFGSEGIYSSRRVAQTSEVEIQQEDGSVTTEEIIQKRTRDRFGLYAYGELQPFRRWAFGLRYDWTQFPETPGQQWAVEPYITFWPSEFLRFRLGYKHTDRSPQVVSTDTGRTLPNADELFFQGTFILGAHPAHPF